VVPHHAGTTYLDVAEETHVPRALAKHSPGNNIHCLLAVATGPKG
jgi:hypothetical protein